MGWYMTCGTPTFKLGGHVGHPLLNLHFSGSELELRQMYNTEHCQDDSPSFGLGFA